MATATTTPMPLSHPLLKPAAPPLHALPPRSHPPSPLLLLLPRQRRRVTITAASAATHLSPARGNEDKAHETVAELLCDHGASPGDAAVIAARAPGYTAMLADGVRELDELGLWASWSAGAGASVNP